MSGDYSRDLKRIFLKAIETVDTYPATRKGLSDVERLVKERDGRVNIIGFGKASARMAQAAEDLFLDHISRSVVITKYDHSLPLKKTEVIEAGHPIPDINGIKGTEKIIELARSATAADLNICLISGGGSSLLVSPVEGISLDDKRSVTEQLFRVGADIFELNTVRKHLSTVKGGRLAEILYPSTTFSLIISDVIGDPLDVIASGPTVPDCTTYLDAFNVLKKYNLIDKVPRSVMEVIRKGVDGEIVDTPSDDSEVFALVDNRIVVSNRLALEAAEKEAERLGYTAEVITSSLSGESRDAAKWLCRQVRGGGKDQRRCYISGGETTVTVRGNGLGGRASEFALAFAIEIEGMDDICLLSAGTDGTDGVTDAAGAIVDGRTATKAREMGLSPESFLDENDSYNFFKKVGGLFITGPTGTNVMDIQIVIRDRK
jgi:glycerate-2-kinase